MIEGIITDVLKAEGWDTYTNDPADRGGPTKWGITLKAWSDYIGFNAFSADIQDINEDEARNFYEEIYIVAPKFSQLPDMLVPLVVDCGVNHGVRAASKWVQRAVGARQDGWIGPATLATVGQQNPIAVYLRVSAYRLRLYGRLVSADKELKVAQGLGLNLQAKFAAGWNNRGTKFLLGLADTLK